MATETLVNLEKSSEMSPNKGEFLASYSKENFNNLAKKKNERKVSVFKLSIEGPILLLFKYFLKECLSSRLTEFKAFITINLIT